MTRKRNDRNSTEFGLWLRGQLPSQITDVRDIDSYNGYMAFNIDYKWSHRNSGKWMFIEEKRYNSDVSSQQAVEFKALHLTATVYHNYKGFHLIQFEKTNPDDGRIWLDRVQITPDELIAFLSFSNSDKWALSNTSIWFNSNWTPEKNELEVDIQKYLK